MRKFSLSPLARPNIERIWITAAEEIGLRVVRTGDAYASSDGAGRICDRDRRSPGCRRRGRAADLPRALPRAVRRPRERGAARLGARQHRRGAGGRRAGARARVPASASASRDTVRPARAHGADDGVPRVSRSHLPSIRSPTTAIPAIAFRSRAPRPRARPQAPWQGAIMRAMRLDRGARWSTRSDFAPAPRIKAARPARGVTWAGAARPCCAAASRRTATAWAGASASDTPACDRWETPVDCHDLRRVLPRGVSLGDRFGARSGRVEAAAIWSSVTAIASRSGATASAAPR